LPGVKSKLGFILRFEMNLLKKIKSWFIIKAKKAKENLKALGWLWGSLCVIVSGVIFYSPSIVLFILYFLSDKGIYLSAAIGYAIWWFSPAFSPALLVYGAILLSVSKIMYFILRRKANES